MKIRVHAEQSGCWCNPERLHSMTDGRVIWLHRRDDGSLPGLLEQVTAIALHGFHDERDPSDVILEWELEAKQ